MHHVLKQQVTQSNLGGMLATATVRCWGRHLCDYTSECSLTISFRKFPSPWYVSVTSSGGSRRALLQELRPEDSTVTDQVMDSFQIFRH